ncbi:MAG TPA: hypothetical protein VF168_12690 [Trueperaceae bacterium]
MGQRQRGSRHSPWWDSARFGRMISVVAGSVVVVAAFAVGRLTADRTPYPVYSWSRSALDLVQFSRQPDDPRELIPLPGQGLPGGQGQSPQQAECPLYFYQEGQLFRMRPGAGRPNGPMGQGNPELFPLEPVPPPSSPSPAPAPPRPPEQQEPLPPFFRAPGVAGAPADGQLFVAGLQVGPEPNAIRSRGR